MQEKHIPPTRDEIVRDLFSRAVSLWGEERALHLCTLIEEAADKLLSLSTNLPHLEEVPTLSWHNRP